MFTGIIEGTGKVVSFQGGKKGGRLIMLSGIPVSSLSLGASVAVDGCCLTVVKKRTGAGTAPLLTFDVSDESIRKTIIGWYQKGDLVNLEQAMKAGGRFGGHIVLGHVDGLGKINSLKRTRGSLKITLTFPKKLGKYIIEKGSVTLNGISLTACEVGKNRLSVYIIPHTEKMTSLSQVKVGSAVNIEVDVLGKYVERCLGSRCVGV